MSLLLNFEDSDITLFSGVRNGRRYKPRYNDYSRVEIVFNSRQCVTSSFFKGLLEEIVKVNPAVNIRLIGADDRASLEFDRAMRRLKLQ